MTEQRKLTIHKKGPIKQQHNKNMLRYTIDRPGLVAFYDIRPQRWVGLFLQTPYGAHIIVTSNSNAGNLFICVVTTLWYCVDIIILFWFTERFLHQVGLLLDSDATAELHMHDGMVWYHALSKVMNCVHIVSACISLAKQSGCLSLLIYVRQIIACLKPGVFLLKVTWNYIILSQCSLVTTLQGSASTHIRWSG